MDHSQQRIELATQRRIVDFDTYDFAVDDLVRRLERGRIDIAPSYQRHFRWEDARQSELIESVFLGIPIPPLFMATNKQEGKTTQWEVVDGIQRLLTCARFVGGKRGLELTQTEDPLRLTGLSKIPSFNGARFSDLPADITDDFIDQPLRVVVLNAKSQAEVRLDLFERLNTGGIVLTPQEIRSCVYGGPFVDLLTELSEAELFRDVVYWTETTARNGQLDELVLRFFAYLEDLESFDHLVREFLDDFGAKGHAEPRVDDRRAVFEQTFGFLGKCFPNKIRRKTRNTTPVVLYEAIAVGAARALSQNPDISPQIEPAWVNSTQLKRLTTGATNTKSMVKERIAYCERQFLNPS